MKIIPFWVIAVLKTTLNLISHKMASGVQFSMKSFWHQISKPSTFRVVNYWLTSILFCECSKMEGVMQLLRHEIKKKGRSNFLINSSTKFSIPSRVPVSAKWPISYFDEIENYVIIWKNVWNIYKKPFYRKKKQPFFANSQKAILPHWFVLKCHHTIRNTLGFYFL